MFSLNCKVQPDIFQPWYRPDWPAVKRGTLIPMLSEYAAKVHAQLWAKIEAEGIILRANVRSGSEDLETTGYFVPNFNSTGHPKIQLYRNNARKDEADAIYLRRLGM